MVFLPLTNNVVSNVLSTVLCMWASLFGRLNLQLLNSWDTEPAHLSLDMSSCPQRCQASLSPLST